MNYEKIEVALHHLQQADEYTRCARNLLNEILAEYDAQNDVAEYKRSLFRFVDDTMRPFPSILQAKTPDAGTSDELAKQGFVEFTQKEIKQMPIHFSRLIIVQKRRCRLRLHKSGEKTTTYEIRFRRDGYEISACGKTIELAKAKFIEKLKTARPKENKTNTQPVIPSILKEFTLYYFEKFRKPKVSEITYKNDFSRLRKHIFPAFGEKEITNVTPADCEELLNNLKSQGKGKTADDVHSLLSAIFKGAIAHGIIERNPLLIVPHSQHERQHGKSLTAIEERELFKRVNGTPYEIFYALALYCGLRPNELKTSRIEGEFIIAVNSKRKNKKVAYKKIPICKRLAYYLQKIDNDLSNLDWRAEKTLSMRFPTFCPGHKLYDLRTTFYSKCKELGIADAARDEFVGHSLGVLGNTYTHLSDEYLLSEGKKLNEW